MTERKKKRGRPPGARNKPKPVELSFNRIKELFANCYTPAQQKKRFMQLKPSEQFRLMAMLEPKARPDPEGGRTIVKLCLAGVPTCRCDAPTMTCTNCGATVERYTPEPTGPPRSLPASVRPFRSRGTRSPRSPRNLAKRSEAGRV